MKIREEVIYQGPKGKTESPNKRQSTGKNKNITE